VTARRVVAAGLLAIVVVLAVALLQRAPRRSGSDLTPNGAFVVALSHGQEACQGGELVPIDTAALQMTIATYGKPGPALSVMITGPRGETLTMGGLTAGWRQGVVRIPLARVAKATEGASVCLRDNGPWSVAVAGDIPDPGYDMQVGGKTVPDVRLRMDYMRPGHESWLALAPTVVHRFSLGKSDLVRHWAWVAVLALMLFAVALATRTIVRAEPPR
jgi:hypothetical protein